MLRSGGVMNRRMYFLLPDIKHARSAVQDLSQNGISQTRMHVIANQNVDTSSLPAPIRRKIRTNDNKIERYIWNGNLVLFFVAMLAGVYLLTTSFAIVAILSLAIMSCCYFGGKYFVEKVPKSYISDFQAAIQHGEILLVVDLPKSHANDIDSLIHRKHPEAIAGGMGWKF